MKAVVPFLRLTTYYMTLIAIVWAALLVMPELSQYLPIGGSGNLTLDPKEFTVGHAQPISWEPVAKAIELFLGLTCVVVFMLPVSWMYMGVRRRRGRDQSFVLTLILLPVAVAGIVIVVENSLALAFSLAGIVAGVRFRYTLDDTLDAIFIFLAIGVGLSSGIGAAEISAVLTAFFNYILLLFWLLEYAEKTSGNRWFARTWMNQGDTGEDDEDDDDFDLYRRPGSGS